MRLDAFKRLFFNDQVMSRFQDNVTTWTDQLSGCPFLRGVLIETLITSSDTIINHGLGKTPEGYLVLSQDANTPIWKITSNENAITLKASTNVNVKIWVF